MQFTRQRKYKDKTIERTKQFGLTKKSHEFTPILKIDINMYVDTSKAYKIFTYLLYLC